MVSLKELIQTTNEHVWKSPILLSTQTRLYPTEIRLASTKKEMKPNLGKYENCGEMQILDQGWWQ